MKRKLISYDAFESIEHKATSSMEQELVEVQDVLAKALEVNEMSLRFFGSENVVYETLDNTFIHANYAVDNGNLVFENIEELIVDEESEKVKGKEIVAKMIDSLLEGDETTANGLFAEYMSLPNYKRNITEAVIKTTITKGTGRVSPFKGGHRPGGHAAALRAGRTRKLNAKRFPGLKSRMNLLRKRAKSKLGTKEVFRKGARDKRYSLRIVNKKKMQEWVDLCENIGGYLEYKYTNPILANTQIINEGEGIKISIPSKEIRTKHKMQSFDWDVLAADSTVKRTGAKKISEDTNFCKAILDLKRHNALSDNDGLEEVLENIVGKWSDVLYLTQNELSNTIKSVLETAGAKNYDDKMCDFMAEGILRVAHNAYVDRVNKILKFAGVQEAVDSKDKYADFKTVVDQFYPVLDENVKNEMEVYVDVYETLRNVYDLADQQSNDFVKNETALHLDALLEILRQDIKPNPEVAEAAINWLADLLESNIEGGEWDVSNSTYRTVNGDNPQMAKNAQKGYTPASDFSGDWGDTAPVSDGKSYRNGLADEMRNSSWANIGDNDTYPTLDNPYVPKPFGDYEIKGEKTIDNDTDLLGHVSNSDTWPALNNPYVPQSVTPQSYKMKNGGGTDLVVDK